MRANETEQAAKAVERLDHRRDERGVAAVTREDLPDGISSRLMSSSAFCFS